MIIHKIYRSFRILSPPRSPGNDSDISEGCLSPLDKDEGFLEPDMIPSSDSPRTSPSAIISNKTSTANNASGEKCSSLNLNNWLTLKLKNIASYHIGLLTSFSVRYCS